jgi:hypothetical protein
MPPRRHSGARAAALPRLLPLLALLAAAGAQRVAAAAAAPAAVLSAAAALAPWITFVRRELHRIPELCFEETKTSAALRRAPPRARRGPLEPRRAPQSAAPRALRWPDRTPSPANGPPLGCGPQTPFPLRLHFARRRHLDDLNIPYKSYARTGLVGRVGSGSPTVVLRTDIDALPVLEPEGLNFRSQHEGHMHACGHDGGQRRPRPPRQRRGAWRAAAAAAAAARRHAFAVGTRGQPQPAARHTAGSWL